MSAGRDRFEQSWDDVDFSEFEKIWGISALDSIKVDLKSNNKENQMNPMFDLSKAKDAPVVHQANAPFLSVDGIFNTRPNLPLIGGKRNLSHINFRPLGRAVALLPFWYAMGVKGGEAVIESIIDKRRIGVSVSNLDAIVREAKFTNGRMSSWNLHPLTRKLRFEYGRLTNAVMPDTIGRDFTLSQVIERAGGKFDWSLKAYTGMDTRFPEVQHVLNTVMFSKYHFLVMLLGGENMFNTADFVSAPGAIYEMKLGFYSELWQLSGRSWKTFPTVDGVNPDFVRYAKIDCTRHVQKFREGSRIFSGAEFDQVFDELIDTLYIKNGQ